MASGASYKKIRDYNNSSCAANCVITLLHFRGSPRTQIIPSQTTHTPCAKYVCARSQHCTRINPLPPPSVMHLQQAGLFLVGPLVGPMLHLFRPVPHHGAAVAAVSRTKFGVMVRRRWEVILRAFLDTGRTGETGREAALQHI